MVGHADGLVNAIVDQQVSQVRTGLARQAGRQSEHLVEVTVVQIALPVHTDHGAAHHRVEVVGAVSAFEQAHVVFEGALAQQGAAKPLHRHVGQGEEVVEADAEMGHQLAPVIRLQRALRGRQHRPLWVVDEVEHQARPFLSVTQRVERLQPRDAPVEHPIAALPVHVGRGIAGQGGGDFDPLLCQKGRQIGLARLRQDGQIASINDTYTPCPGLTHQGTEVFVQFRCPPSQVQRTRLTCSQDLHDQLHGVRVHHLGAVGPRIDMAVNTGLVALVAQVDLQGLQRAAPDRREVGLDKQGKGRSHR